MSTETAALPLMEKDLLEVAKHGNREAFPPGAVLVTEGDDGDALYIILEGRVKACVVNDDGREVLFGMLGVGEYFGELSLDGGTRAATVVALERTVCSVIGSSKLKELISAEPRLSLRLILDLIGRVRSLTANIKGLSFDETYLRVACLLHRLSENNGSMRVVKVGLTVDDIALRIGASAEMTGRVISELRAQGIIESTESGWRLLKSFPPVW